MASLIDTLVIRAATALTTTAAVKKLEHTLLGFPQVDLQTTHIIHGNMCARTIFVPRGTVLTGAITNLDNICVIYGDITVTTNCGPRRFSGFNVIPANSGLKRAGYANEDTYWTTLWPTDLTDVEAAEDEMTTESSMLQTRRLGITFEGNSRLLLAS